MIGGLSNFLMGERDISANACQWICGVSWTWPGQQIKRGAACITREKWIYIPWYTSTNGDAILSSSWPSLSFEVVANLVFYWSCEYFPNIYSIGQWWSNIMQLKFHDSRNCPLFVTIPKVGMTDANPTDANHFVRTQKLWILKEQCQICRWVVRLGQNRVPHTWVLNMGPGDYDNHA